MPEAETSGRALSEQDPELSLENRREGKEENQETKRPKGEKI